MRAKIRSPEICQLETDISEVSDHLRAATAGTYQLNHGLIRLSRDYSFWNPDNTPTVGRLAVFVHEYLHFVHNFSTIAGLSDFDVQLRLLHPFCNTVETDGLSAGSSVLDAVHGHETQQLLEWRTHLRGHVGNEITIELKPLRAHPQFVKYASTKRIVHVGGSDIECHGVVVTFDKSSHFPGESAFEMSIGSDILMEGCALEAECMLFERAGLSANALRRGAPVYPYQTARAIFEGIVGVAPSSIFLCSLCLLALQSTDPGDAFIQLVCASKTGAKKIDEETLLKEFKASSDATTTAFLRKFLKDTLEPDIAPFKERGHAGSGLVRMANWSLAFVHERVKDSSFEIAAIDKMPDVSPLVDLLRAMPVCPVIQEANKADGREEIIFFSPEEIVPEEMAEIGVAQSLLHFSATHLKTDGAIIPTTSVRPRKCLFVDVCQAPLANARSEICRKSPWQAFDPKASEGCWYAQGVRAARARPSTK